MRRPLNLLVCVAVLAATASNAAAYDRLVVFGDSLSDVGNIDQATFGVQPGSDYFNGRFSNGPLYVEHLAGELGVGSLVHSRAGGDNYAHGGALTSGTGFPTNLFVRDLDDQVDNFLGGDVASDDDLFLVYIGGNDIASLTDAGGGNVQPRVDDLLADLGRLYDAGARNFLVPNLPPIGSTPRYNATSSAGLANTLTDGFNDALLAGLASFGQSRPDADTFHLDVAGLFDGLLADPASFGFSNVTEPALSGGGVVADPNSYLFWDDFHPTSAAHALLGQEAFELLPNPLADDLLFNPPVAVGPFRPRDPVASPMVVPEPMAGMAVLVLTAVLLVRRPCFCYVFASQSHARFAILAKQGRFAVGPANRNSWRDSPMSHASHAASSAVCRSANACFERLEQRRMLHGGGGGLDPALVAYVRNLVENDGDTSAYINTDYDPHAIGVPGDTPRLLDPVDPPASRGVDQGALPDMLPWAGPNGNNYFYNTSLDTFSITGRSLLRFSTAIANAGAGPVELRAGEINDDGTQKVYQRIYDYDAGGNEFTVREDREAGNFIYHPGHNHLHFEGYADYRLLQNVDGEPGGLAQRDDGTEVLGEKVGFCLINITSYDTSLPGYSASPGSYNCGSRQGISVGRADVYGSSLDSQWIDVTGVPAGEYFMQVTLDANNAILESDETNNTIVVPVTISDTGSTANGTQPDRFDNIADNGSFETATDFGSLGDVVEASLTLHAGYDQDFYQFTAASTGEVSVTLTYQGGDPNLFLYDQSQTEIGRSTKNFGTENVTVDVVGGQTYYIMAENFQYLDDIVDNYALQIDGPIAEVSTDTVRRTAEGRSFVVNIHRTGPVFEPLTADLTFGGTATFGVDYTVDTTFADFGAEAETVQVTVTVLEDGIAEGLEVIEIGVASDASYVASADVSRVLIGPDRRSPRGDRATPTVGGPVVGPSVGGGGLLQAAPPAGSLFGDRADRLTPILTLDDVLATPFSNDLL